MEHSVLGGISFGINRFVEEEDSLSDKSVKGDVQDPTATAESGSSAFSPWKGEGGGGGGGSFKAEEQDSSCDEDQDDINVDDTTDDDVTTMTPKTSSVKRPSVFSVTSLLAPDTKARSPSPPKRMHPGPHSFRPPPFFYPGLTLDMLNKSSVAAAGRNAAAAAALAAAAAATGGGGPAASPASSLPMFPFPGLMKTAAAAAAAASMDANRYVYSNEIA